MSKIISPSFFVIGAQKAGTTALHDWLSTSTEIALPRIKETHFFSETERYQRGWGWYEKQFSEKALRSSLAVGEVDPDYLFFPEAALRIHEAIKNPKIIILLREPLSRAYSQYLMTCRRGYEKLTFARALCVENERCAPGERFNLDHFSYIARGMYSNQILRMKQIFPSSEMLFIKYEDLFDREKNSAEFNKICAFIGVDSGSVQIDPGRKSNQASSPRFIFLRDFIYRPSKFKQWLGKFICSEDMKLKLAMWVDQMNIVPDSKAKNKSWADEVPGAVHALLFNECQKISALTGLNLDDWAAYHHSAISEKSKAGSNL